MSHRFSTWWRALGVVLLGLATVTWPSAAQAAPTLTFDVVHQDAAVTLSARGSAHFNVTISLSTSDIGARAKLTIYPHLVERSKLDAIIAGRGTTAPPLATTNVFPLYCGARGPLTFAVLLYTNRPGSLREPCAPVAPRLRLACFAARCDGVYPLRLQVMTRGTTTTKWSLVAVQATSVYRPVQVALIETLGPSTWHDPSRSLAVLGTIARHSSSRLTLSADYRTLNDLQGGGDRALALRTALVKAVLSPLHQVVAAPPANIDFAGLAAVGLKTQVGEQLALSANLLKSLTGRYLDSPVLLSGTPPLANVIALQHFGVTEMVLPEGALALAPSSTLTWGAPFHVTGAGSSSALSTDQPLGNLVTSQLIEPGRRAALALATIDFLHFEAPYAPAMRTVVIASPLAQTSATFITDLLNGFAHDPFAQLATLSPSFNGPLVGTNGAPTSRSLRNTSSRSTWSVHNVQALRSLIGDVASYSQAVTSSNVGDALRVAVAMSEIVGDANTRQAAIDAAGSALNSELNNFSVDPSAVTLTGPGTSLPITLISRANYTVTAVVHLVTDRLSFPRGKNIAVVLDSPTKSLRIATSNHRGSSLILQVYVTTPDGQIILARAAIQVRIAGTSIVGYVLTGASILVLALWWLQTLRRRSSKGRHAR